MSGDLRHDAEGNVRVGDGVATQAPIGEDLKIQIEREVKKASAIVEKYEADAKKKGVALKLEGARYRIYNTDIAS